MNLRKNAGNFMGLSRRGQLVIPAIFIIPTLFMFVYLIFETTKLSREKIRRQFGVDSASFIELTNAADFMNRTAYVNGSFPHRVFKEAWDCAQGGTTIGRTDDGPSECGYDLMYEMGAFPKLLREEEGIDSEAKWPIRFTESPTDKEGHPNGRGGFNMNQPDLTSIPSRFALMTKERVQRLYFYWEDGKTGQDHVGDFFKLWVQVYTLLGSIEESQKSVYDALTKNFNFFKKSYMLNTGDCDSADTCAEDGLRQIRQGGRLEPNLLYIDEIYLSGRQWTKVGWMAECGIVEGTDQRHLFQLAVVPTVQLKRMEKGYDVYQGWKVPGNFFAAGNLGTLYGCGGDSGILDSPCVHNKVKVICPDGGNNCVWPDPTPKYQVRVLP